MLDRDLGQIIEQQSQTDGILVAMRESMLLDPVELSEQDIILPESFQRGLYPHWGRLIRRGVDEAFLLTERPSFSQTIDSFFYLLPSKLIEFYLGQSRGRQVRILDAGGGRDGTTARDIAARYSAVQVTSVDIVAINERRGNFISRQGDLCSLDESESTIDFAYSHQVLPYMNRRENYSRQQRVIGEIYRVLKPGGTAVIDFTNDLAMPVNILKIIDEELGCILMPKRKTYGGVFLFLAKPLVDPVVMNIGGKVQNLTI